MLEWTIENQQGSGGKLTSSDIFGQLQQAGENPIGISPDGQIVKINDGQGTFEVKTQDILKGLGWQVKGVTPESTIADYAKPGWRIAVAKLPNDIIREAYLKEQLQNIGFQNPQVVGTDTDWHVFNPNDGKYYAMTNKPGLDSTDLASAALHVPGFMGGVAGGALGSGAGPIGMVGGSAVGSALGESAARAIIAQGDPVFSRLLQENLGATAGDVGKTALIDAATAGTFKALPLAAKMLGGTGNLTRGLLEHGPGASIARGVGHLAEEGGALGQTVARAAGSPTGRQVTAALGPITGDLTGYGYAAQAPGMLSRGLSSLYQKFGGRGQAFAKGLEYEPARAAASMPERFAKVMRPSYEPSPGVGPIPQRETTESIFRELGRQFGGALGGQRKDLLRRYKEFRALGDMPAEEAYQWAHLGSTAEGPGAEAATRWANRGASLGRGIGAMERFGERAEKLGTDIAGTAAGAAEMGFGGLRRGGQALRGVGTILQPLENRAYARYGAEEYTEPAWEDYWRRKKAMVPSKTELVSNY